MLLRKAKEPIRYCRTYVPGAVAQHLGSHRRGLRRTAPKFVQAIHRMTGAEPTTKNGIPVRRCWTIRMQIKVADERLPRMSRALAGIRYYDAAIIVAPRDRRRILLSLPMGLASWIPYLLCIGQADICILRVFFGAAAPFASFGRVRAVHFCDDRVTQRDCRLATGVSRCRPSHRRSER